MEPRIQVRQDFKETILLISRREMEVVQAIAEGKTSVEIGNQLGITSKTVETHRGNILRRLGCRNTANLIHVCHQEKLLS